MNTQETFQIGSKVQAVGGNPNLNGNNGIIVSFICGDMAYVKWDDNTNSGCPLSFIKLKAN